MKIAPLIAILLLFGVVNAQFNPFGAVCSALFPPANANIDYTEIVSISITIVFCVLLVLGIVYALGYGFGIDSMKTFVRTEILESVFNIVLIALVASGLTFAGGAIWFFASIASVGSSGPTGSCGSTTTVYDAYSCVCSNYVNGAISVLPYAIGTAVNIVILTTFKSIFIGAAPSDFGFLVNPFAGLQPVINLFDMELDFFILMIGFFIAVPALLSIIYGLFPYFLYAGVLLRSMPWTRAAGGSFIGLFIAFYIVFPAILLPFSSYVVTGSFTISSNPLVSIANAFVFAITEFGSIIVFLMGNTMYAEVQSFASVASGLALQLLGLLISLLISLDLVEVLGDLLGAPSLHTKKLLSKVI